MKAILPSGNAAALNHVAGEYYTPLQYGPSHSGGLTYNLTVDGSGRVARPSFIGRTVIEVPDSTKPISPDNIAKFKPVKNPTFRVTHPDGTTISKTISGEFHALPNGVADAFDGTAKLNTLITYKVTGQEAIWAATNGVQLRIMPLLGKPATTGIITHTTNLTVWGGVAGGCTMFPFTQDIISVWHTYAAEQLEAGTPIMLVYQPRHAVATHFDMDLPLAPGVNKFTASDENGVLQSVTVDVIPGPEMAIPHAKNANTVAGTSKIYALDGANKIPIPDNADIDTDTFLAPGLYACASNAVAATVKHNPFGASAFDLRTEVALLPASKPYLIQTAQLYDTGAIKYRTVSTWTGAPIFGPWQTVAATESCNVTPLNGWVAGIADNAPFVSHKIGPLVYVMGTVKNPSATTATSNCLSLQFPTTVFVRPFVHDVNGKAYRCEINQGIMSIRDPVSANTVLYITITYPTH